MFSFLRIFALVTFCLPGGAIAEGPVRNVLFIGVDDLRPELGCYGNEYMRTPHLDKLAASGVRFEHAYCQVAVCGASRLGLMSGLRPEHLNAWTHDERLDKKRPDVKSLPAHLKANSWSTFSFGKIYHHRDDDAAAWTEPAWRSDDTYEGANRKYEVKGYFLSASREAMETSVSRLGKGKRGPASENGGDTPDDKYPDYRIASAAIEKMRAHRDKPFFIAVGFKKPHLPFNAPGRYWDLYDRSSIEVPPDGIPKDSPAYAASSWGELKNYSDIDRKKNLLSPEKSRELIHGYRACVSMIDAQVGRLMKALDELGLRENTLVVFWSDHGFYLGDFGDWCKHTNYEIATRIPYILSGPGLASGKGSQVPVELVDLYPTICKQLGLAVPGHCHGSDLSPELQAPGTHSRVGAFSQYRKRKPGVGTVLGTSLRTERFRLTAWHAIDGGKLEDLELYDFKHDPGATRSVHKDPEYSGMIDELLSQSAKAKKGFPLTKK
jgi:iduronate 2-sulfatase